MGSWKGLERKDSAERQKVTKTIEFEDKQRRVEATEVSPFYSVKETMPQTDDWQDEGDVDARDQCQQSRVAFQLRLEGV